MHHYGPQGLNVFLILLQICSYPVSAQKDGPERKPSDNVAMVGKKHSSRDSAAWKWAWFTSYPTRLPDSLHLGCKQQCCWPRTQTMLLISLKIKWQCYGYPCTHRSPLWRPSTILHCAWCAHVMPWEWRCLYKMKVYIVQAFRVGYVFYGHLTLS